MTLEVEERINEREKKNISASVYLLILEYLLMRRSFCFYVNEIDESMSNFTFSSYKSMKRKEKVYSSFLSP
jgi:hypothetical protein